jgi:hypothetical protein
VALRLSSEANFVSSAKGTGFARGSRDEIGEEYSDPSERDMEASSVRCWSRKFVKVLVGMETVSRVR